MVNGEPPGADGLTRSWRNAWTIEGERAADASSIRGACCADEQRSVHRLLDLAGLVHLRSYVDVLEGRVPREVFAGKTVFVGATAVELSDMLSVPVYRSLPGIVVQALAAETVNVGAPRVPPRLGSLGLLALWTRAHGAALRGKRGAHGGATWPCSRCRSAAIAGLVACSVHYDRLLLDAAAPLLVSVLLFVAVTVRSLEAQTWRALAYSLGMRRRDALLKSVVQSSTDCIVCIDEAGIIKTANPAASRLFDCAAYELIDEPIAKFITLLAGDGAGARLGALHGEIRECDARTLDWRSVPGGDFGEPRAAQHRTAVHRHRARHPRAPCAAAPPAAPGHARFADRSAEPRRAARAPRGRARPRTRCGRRSRCSCSTCAASRKSTTRSATTSATGCCAKWRSASRRRSGDRGFIARIGGDEFTVVLDPRRERRSHRQHVASCSADCLRTPIDVAGISIEVGVSIGIARFPQDASDAQTLLRHADVAMYVAKRRGAPFEYYDAAHDENTVRRLAIGGELRSAIANNALELHFQPQVNLRSGMVESAEALVRWFHPMQGAIGPDEFIAIAEATDLIRPLTEWTLTRRAGADPRLARARRARAHRRESLGAPAAGHGFPGAARGNCSRTSGVSAASLELEITESAMMLDPARALRVIQEIDRLGVLISIDDFGTGYSSLGYLRDLPVHSLKLDKSFVMGMRDNTDDRIIVESTAQMAHALKLELVAEGVETEWDAQFLAAAGYDFAQGFHYSRALPADKCLAWIVEFNATAMLTAGDTTVTTALRARAECEDDSNRLPGVARRQR